MESTIPYDNDITRLYKYAEKSKLPIDLIIPRSRTEEDDHILSGTEKYVLESLEELIQRLEKSLPDNSEKVPDMVEMALKYSKTISIEDFAMVYYGHLRFNYPSKKKYFDLVNEVFELEESPMLLQDEGELENRYITWRTKMMEKLAVEKKKMDTIKSVQEALEDIEKRPKLSFSPVNITNSTVAFSPTIERRQVKPEDGVDIFDKSIVSKYVPYIRYNNKYGKSFSKVYTGEKMEEEPNYNITVIPSSEANENDAIYMKLWHGDVEETGTVLLKDEPKNSFSTIIYYLRNNFLTVESPSKEHGKNIEEQSHKRTKAALPNLVFGQGREVKVRGDFKIWGVTIEEIGFLDMILLDPIMNVYLYVEENIKSFALKERLDIHYRSIFSDIDEGEKITEESYISNYASVSMTLSQKYSDEDTIQLADTLSRQLSQAKVTKDTPYINVSISKAESRQVVSDFIPVFSLLMKYYLDNRDEVIENYNDFFPELEALAPLLEQRKQKTDIQESMIINLTKKSAVGKRANEKIRNLRDLAPDLFVLKYAKECQHKRQPIIIDPSEVDDWKEKRIPKTQKERQVMPFPKNDPKWLITCPDDARPYPGVKENIKLPNKDIYPYVPCCFTTDQMGSRKNSTYKKYLQIDQVERKVGAKSDKKISTKKVLSKEKFGTIPASVETITSRYSPNSADMVRYGMIYSKSSLIHCVCVAMSDPNYYNKESDEEKEYYVLQLREYISKNVDPSLLKQELYDYPDDEILSILEDGTKFLDPALFYRAIEEIFGINVYVFSDDDTDEPGYLEIPRHKIFHSRPIRPNRPTIVIIKTFGSDSDALEFPQCELVVDYDIQNQQIAKIFGVEMTTICHKTLTSTMKSLTWVADENENLITYANIYSYADHLNIFKFPPVSQLIDPNGKMRAITFNLGKSKVTIGTIPSQPENLPHSDKIHKVSFETAVELLGNPSAVTKNQEGKIDGLWFDIFDVEYGEYIPIIPKKETIQLPLGPRNPILAEKGVNITKRITKLRRDMSIITQLVRWLYELAKSKRGLDVDDFANAYMVTDAWEKDSSEYYDFSKLGRRLPKTETIQGAISILERKVPTLFSEGRIVMYSTLFAHVIIKMLKDYNNLRIGLIYSPPEFIDGFYETEEDFKKEPGTKIFIAEKDLASWMSLTRKSKTYDKNTVVHSKIDVSSGFSTIPYLYKDDDGMIFIIQNVFGSEEKAFATAEKWHTDMINIGSDPEPLRYVPEHMVYGISSESKLIPIEDNTDGSLVFLRVVYYGTQIERETGKDGRWGAVLKVL